MEKKYRYYLVHGDVVLFANSSTIMIPFAALLLAPHTETITEDIRMDFHARLQNYCKKLFIKYDKASSYSISRCLFKGVDDCIQLDSAQWHVVTDVDNNHQLVEVNHYTQIIVEVPGYNNHMQVHLIACDDGYGRNLVWSLLRPQYEDGDAPTTFLELVKRELNRTDSKMSLKKLKPCEDETLINDLRIAVNDKIYSKNVQWDFHLADTAQFRRTKQHGRFEDWLRYELMYLHLFYYGTARPTTISLIDSYESPSDYIFDHPVFYCNTNELLQYYEDTYPDHGMATSPIYHIKLKGDRKCDVIRVTHFSTKSEVVCAPSTIYSTVSLQNAWTYFTSF